MSKSDFLFQLVKSLTASEKRYFKLFTKRNMKNRDSNNEILFNIIDEIDNSEVYKKSRSAKSELKYDEKEIVQRFHKKTNISNISPYKNILYNELLKSLRLFNAQKRAEFKIRALMLDIQILIDKKLDTQALKRIQQAKKIATEYDYHFPALELLLIERQIIRRKGTKISDTLNSLAVECQKLLSQIDTQLSVLDTFEPFHLGYRLENIEKTEKELLAFNAEKILTEIESNFENLQDIPFPIQRTFFSLKLNYLFYHSRDFAAAYILLQEYIQNFEETPKLILEHTDLYVRSLYYFLTFCLNLKKFHEIPPGLKKMRKLTLDKELNGFGINDKDIITQVFQHSYSIEHRYCLFTEQFEKGERLLKNIKIQLEIHEKNIQDLWLLSFYINIIGGLIEQKNFEESIFWINKTNALKETKGAKLVVQLVFHFFQVIAHIEIKNEGLVSSSLLRSLSSFHKKNEKKLLKFKRSDISDFTNGIRKICKLNKESSKKEIYQSLFNKLSPKWTYKEMKEVNHWLKYKAEAN